MDSMSIPFSSFPFRWWVGSSTLARYALAILIQLSTPVFDSGGIRRRSVMVFIRPANASAILCTALSSGFVVGPISGRSSVVAGSRNRGVRIPLLGHGSAGGCSVLHLRHSGASVTFVHLWLPNRGAVSGTCS
jgi:hypothetical protein